MYKCTCTRTCAVHTEKKMAIKRVYVCISILQWLKFDDDVVSTVSSTLSSCVSFSTQFPFPAVSSKRCHREQLWRNRCELNQNPLLYIIVWDRCVSLCLLYVHLQCIFDSHNYDKHWLLHCTCSGIGCSGHTELYQCIHVGLRQRQLSW